MTTKTIKGVDEDTWSEFKSGAAKSKKSMGEFLAELIDTYERAKSNKNWNKFLTVSEPLSDYEANKIREEIKESRKGGFREYKWD